MSLWGESTGETKEGTMGVLAKHRIRHVIKMMGLLLSVSSKVWQPGS